MESKVKTVEAAPTHAKEPFVTNVHKILPVTPSGWVKAIWPKTICGM